MTAADGARDDAAQNGPAGRPRARPGAQQARPGAQQARPAAQQARPAANPQGGPLPPYEQARDELTDLVRRLEAGGLTLEQSLELWERGERLAAICSDWLEGARARLAEAAASRAQEPGDPAAPF